MAAGEKEKGRYTDLAVDKKNSFKTELEKSRLRRKSKGGQREEMFQKKFF